MAANSICNPPLPLHSLNACLQTAQGKELAGATGGIQGVKGTLFGTPYAAGSG